MTMPASILKRPASVAACDRRPAKRRRVTFAPEVITKEEGGKSEERPHIMSGCSAWPAGVTGGDFLFRVPSSGCEWYSCRSRYGEEMRLLVTNSKATFERELAGFQVFSRDMLKWTSLELDVCPVDEPWMILTLAFDTAASWFRHHATAGTPAGKLELELYNLTSRLSHAHGLSHRHAHGDICVDSFVFSDTHGWRLINFHRCQTDAEASAVAPRVSKSTGLYKPHSRRAKLPARFQDLNNIVRVSRQLRAIAGL